MGAWDRYIPNEMSLVILRFWFHPEGMLGLGQALYHVGKSPIHLNRGGTSRLKLFGVCNEGYSHKDDFVDST